MDPLAGAPVTVTETGSSPSSGSLSLPSTSTVTVVSSSVEPLSSAAVGAVVHRVHGDGDRGGVTETGEVADLVGEAVGAGEVGIRGVVDRSPSGFTLVEPLAGPLVTVTDAGSSPSSTSESLPSTSTVTDESSSTVSESSTASGASLTEFTVMSTVAVEHCGPTGTGVVSHTW